MSKRKVLDIINATAEEQMKIGALATVAEGAPRARYMGALVGDDLTVRMAAFSGSDKIAQIEAEPRVEIVFHKEGGMGQARVRGRATIVADPGAKKRFWDDAPVIKEYFKGPDDPDYALVEVKPELVLYHGEGEHEARTWRPGEE